MRCIGAGFTSDQAPGGQLQFSAGGHTFMQMTRYPADPLVNPNCPQKGAWLIIGENSAWA